MMSVFIGVKPLGVELFCALAHDSIMRGFTQLASAITSDVSGCIAEAELSSA
jgi:hypothetical protein